MKAVKTPVKSIRLYCLECCCNQKSEVSRCELVDCPIYPFRLGKNPNRLGIGRKLEKSK